MVSESDIQEAYELIKGSRFASLVLDAQTACRQGDHPGTIDLLAAARERYEQAHQRSLRFDPVKEAGSDKNSDAQNVRFTRQHEKAKKTIATFDALIAGLKRMVRLSGGKTSPPARPVEARSASSPPPPEKPFAELFAEADSPQGQLDVIRRHFRLQAVASVEQIQPDRLYWLRGKEQTYLIHCTPETMNDAESQVALREAFSERSLRSLSAANLVKQGQRKRLFELVAQDESETTTVAGEAETAKESAADLGPDPSASALQVRRNDDVLDMGAFTQLADSARRCELVGNVDLIANVRDREFRLGNFQAAFQHIEGLFAKFSASASQRDQRLRQEDQAIASGKVKMSPKDLLAKRARDNAQSQAVNRARTRFQRVLEGLRVLMRS